ncbi:hypothetical protein F2P79_009148 [Pimephales promelas]|nr:hypothetical protein F2P79_009148 [Pimephales promelas]
MDGWTKLNTLLWVLKLSFSSCVCIGVFVQVDVAAGPYLPSTRYDILSGLHDYDMEGGLHIGLRRLDCTWRLDLASLTVK